MCAQLGRDLAVLRESLRVTPSIPQFTVTCDKDEIIGDGKYLIEAGTSVDVSAGMIGKDPLVWGADVSLGNENQVLFDD